MKAFIYLATVSLLSLFSCSSPYKKAGDGFEYKTIQIGNGKKLQYAKYLEFHLSQRYVNNEKDTVLGDTREYMPRVEKFDSFTVPPHYLKILNNARKGDSIIIRIATDSAYRPFKNPMPRHFKPGGYIYTTIKLLDIFETADQADSAKLALYRMSSLKIYNKRLKDFEKGIEKENEQIQSDSKIIGTYLDQKNIQYTRGKWGTFIVIHEEGQGKKIRYNDVVAVDYLAKELGSGRVFDSNTDPRFNHQDNFEVTMSQPGSVIAGFTDALMQLNQGTKATVYIPSPLAFGKKGYPRSQIKPDEIVVLDLEIKVVISEFQAMEIVSKNRQRAEAAEQKMNDSLKKIKINSYLFPYGSWY